MQKRLTPVLFANAGKRLSLSLSLSLPVLPQTFTPALSPRLEGLNSDNTHLL